MFSLRSRLAGRLGVGSGARRLVAAGLMAAAISRVNATPEAGLDYDRDVRPIFAAHCFDCHGPSRSEAGLRLDSRGVVMGGQNESGTVISPGKASESLLVRLIKGEDPKRAMPRKSEPLAADQIATIEQWINSGAAWAEGNDPAAQVGSRDHWAFKRPERPALPEVRKEGWGRTPVDPFVLERLEKEGLSPSPEAGRTTLIRRLSLDLTGLPPTIEEIDAFLNDTSADAYDKLVERLLDSPHYGERWGRHWLDAARYADTNGYEKDQYRAIWPYRDYVIGAFNRDLPFDQFTREQVAGDLLPNAGPEQLTATGFLRNSMLNEEGGVDPEQFRVEAIVDRVDTLGKTFLGLTVNCAQCHTHKYDPITHKEYYQLFAFVNNDDEPDVEIPTSEQVAKRQSIRSEIESAERDLAANSGGLAERMDAWEAEAKAKAVDWRPLEPKDWFGAIGVKFEKMNDGSLLALAHNPGESSYVVVLETKLTNITALRLEAMTDPNLPRNGPGRSPNGNFVVQDFEVRATPLADPSTTNTVALRNATADFSQPEFEVAKAIDGDKKTGWAVAQGPLLTNQDRKAVFETVEPLGFEGGTRLTITLWQKHGSAHTLGRFRISATTQAGPVAADPLPAEVRAILAKGGADRSAEERARVFGYYRTVDSRFAEASKRILELQNSWPMGMTTLALRERMENPRVTHIFKRGDFKNPGAAIRPGVPSALHPLPPKERYNRLDLADWLVDPANPLTARVIVNRVWQAYFGQGLVATPEDFGTRCDPPSHPGLLDWLACDFRDGGWSFKNLHRTIVKSATYRQQSAVSPELLEADPYNVLLARAPRVRVDAEIVRDIALSAAGLLSRKVGGPSVFPPIPDGVLNLAYGGPMKWEVSPGGDKYRRGMYTFWKRTAPYPGLTMFDAPNADFSCVRRVKSNTPLQALTTLNDAVFTEAAQALALRVYRESGGDEGRLLETAWRLCTGRAPDAFERDLVMRLYQGRRSYFDDRTAAALEVASPDKKSPPEDVNLHKVAAWTMVARVLLNLDETIVKD